MPLSAFVRAFDPRAPGAEHLTDVERILGGAPVSTMPLAVFVAQYDRTLVGFVEVGLRSHADGCDPSRPCGFLEGWYVQPDHTGQGIGRALVESAENWARRHGCTELASDTWLDNERSQRAHQALGFEVVDRCINYRKTIASLEGTGTVSTADLYGADLSPLHHEYFSDVAEAAGANLLRRLRAGPDVRDCHRPGLLWRDPESAYGGRLFSGCRR